MMRKVYADISYTTEHSIGLRPMSRANAARLLNTLPAPCDAQEQDIRYLLWAIANPDLDFEGSQS